MKVLIFGKGGISAGIKRFLRDDEVIEVSKEDCDVRQAYAVMRCYVANYPDWVINCAGVSYPGLTNYKEEIDTNLYGAMNVAVETGGTPQIHIASVAGLYGKPNHTGYCASKAGVISMVQSLGFTRPIWAISPGRVDTEMRERDYPNDTPGSRLCPTVIGMVVKEIMEGKYESGTNVVVRKEGLVKTIVEEHKGDGWRERLRVGEPVTI